MSDAFHLFENMKTMRITPDMSTYSSLIGGFCKVGKVSAAKDVFKDMQDNKFTPDLIITYIILITELFDNDHFDEAMDLFYLKENSGMRADIRIYSNIIDGMCKARKLDKVKELFYSLPSKGVHRSTRTYNITMSITQW